MRVHPLCLLHTNINQSSNKLDLVQTRLAGDFHSPSESYINEFPSFYQLLVKHPAATLIARASGEPLLERGILDGSILIIDQSVTPAHNDTVVASINGDYTIKILDLKNRLLQPANQQQEPVPLPENLDKVCEGVVTYCIAPHGNIGFDC